MQLIPTKDFPDIWREILFPTENLLCLTPLLIVLLLQKELICGWDGWTYIPQTEHVWGASTVPSPPWSARWARVASSPPPRTHPAPAPLWAPGHLLSPQSSAREKSNNTRVKKKFKDIYYLVPSLASPNILRVISGPEASDLEDLSKEPLPAGSTRRCSDWWSMPPAHHRQYRLPASTRFQTHFEWSILWLLSPAPFLIYLLTDGN